MSSQSSDTRRAKDDFDSFDPRDDAPMYEEPEERRSRLVPVLMGVAAVLAIAVGVAAVLFFLGVFDRKSTPTLTATVEDSAPATSLTPPAATDTRQAAPLTPADTAATQDVPKAVVSVAPPAPGEPPIRSTHGDWQVRCDTPAGAQTSS